MYKIMVKHNSNVKSNVWEIYGSTTTSTDGTSTFTEFSTDDVTVLEEELLKLDKVYGHENLRAFSEVATSYLVDVTV